MLQEKRNDLDAEKQKKLLQRIVSDLSHSSPQFYYMATSEVARLIHKHIQDASNFNAEERKLLEPLSARDIEVVLSLN